MSDTRKIADSRRAWRASAPTEQRLAKATEDLSDSAEGIRQDTTLLTEQLAQLINAINQLSYAIGRR